MKLEEKFIRLARFLNLLRFWQWHDKTELLLIAAAILAVSDTIYAHVAHLILFILYIHFLAAYGYVLNSFFDREVDCKVGKDYFVGFSKRFVAVIIILFGIGALTLPFLFYNQTIIFLNVIIIFFVTFYSAKPLRLKDRGLAGIVTATLTQLAPIVFFLYLIPQHTALFWYLFGWLVLEGFLLEMTHQVLDYNGDITTNTKTFAVKIGTKKGKYITYYVCLLFVGYIAIPMLYFSYEGALLSMALLIFSMNWIHYALFSVRKVKVTE